MKHLKLFLAAAACSMLVPVLHAAQEGPPSKPIDDRMVYVIPIRGQIEPALTYVVRRGLKEAARNKASAVILHMDTLGGRLDATEEICDLLKRTDLPLYTYVEGNAISAGAIIALTTPTIYMAPGSKIGDAMPIVMGQQLGEAEREKAESFTDTMIRSNAEHGGHNKDLATAMVRRSSEFKIGDEIISAEGQLLTMTASEAAREFDGKPLLSSGTIEDFDQFLVEVGFEKAEVRTLEVTALEMIARFIAALAPLLMMAGIACIYIEIQSPGLGLPAAGAIFCFSMFFFGHHIAGLAGLEEVVIFVLGVILLIVELFILPGFGITGILGACMILWSLLTSMVSRLPGEPIIPDWSQFNIPLLKLMTAIILAGMAIGVLSRYLPKNRAFGKLILTSSTDRAEGYTPNKRSLSDLAGQTGETLSQLRPSGTALIGDRRQDVVTRGEFLEAGTPIVVVETHGNHVIVESRNVS